MVFFIILISKSMMAQGNQFVGEVKIFAGNFAPIGWAKCEGQLLPISQNTALFSLLGTYYGGNGTTNFALPDLRDRMVVGEGQGPGLSFYDIGQTGGASTVTIQDINLPAHTHTGSVRASSAAATTTVPTAGMSLATSSNNFNNITNTVLKYTSAAGNVTLIGGNTQVGSTSLPLNISQPYLVSNYIIALQGIYPSRP